MQNGDTGSSHGSGSVVLSRVGGGPISKEEAESLLGQYGPIQEMYPTTHADARLHGTPEGMWVKFAYYLDFKDAARVSCPVAISYTITNIFLAFQQIFDPLPGYGATQSRASNST